MGIAKLRGIRRGSGTLLVLGLGALGATLVAAQDFAAHAPAAPAARMRKLAKMSSKSRTCAPREGDANVCAVSGLRVHDGALWVTMDSAIPAVARAPIPRGGSGQLDLSGPFQFTVHLMSDAARAPGCDGVGDAEAIAFDREGGLLLATDRWQLVRARVAAAGRPAVKGCKQFKPRLPSNRGFEAMFVTADGVHMITENVVDGMFRIYTEPLAGKGAPREAGFRWDLAACKTDKLRITDAAAVGDGALLLASCKTWQGHNDYFLGRLRLGTAGSAKLTWTTRIANPKQRNLEGLAITDDGRLLVINDDSEGTQRDGTTKLWEILVPKQQRKSLLH